MSQAPSETAPDAGPVADPTAARYYSRARGLLLAPTAEWSAIAAERPTIRQLFLRWVLPLTLLFFLAPQLGAIAFPATIDGKAVAPSLASALYTTLVGTAFMVAGVWALAWIVDYFAPGFGARRDPAQALKLAAYSCTGLWLSGLIGLAPPLILLGALGVVSIYTLYRGLPVLMHAPPDKALPYAAAVVGAAATMAVVLMALSSCFAMFADAPPPPKTKAPIVAPATPTAAIDPAAPLEIDKLRRLAPDAMPGGWVRTGVTRNAGGALGFTGPTSEATYENGPRRIVLRAIDLGVGGGVAPNAALLATRPARDDPRALVVHSEEAGRYTFEETDRTAGATQLLVVVGERIALALEGHGGVTAAQLREALALIDMVRVEQIAKGL